MKASLVFAFVLVLIVGITIPSGVIAAAVPKSTPLDFKQILDNLTNTVQSKLIELIRENFGF